MFRMLFRYIVESVENKNVRWYSVITRPTYYFNF